MAINCICGFWEPNLGLLKEQPVLVTARLPVPSPARFLLSLNSSPIPSIPCAMQLDSHSRCTEAADVTEWFSGVIKEAPHRERFGGWSRRHSFGAKCHVGFMSPRKVAQLSSLKEKNTAASEYGRLRPGRAMAALSQPGSTYTPLSSLSSGPMW